MHLNTNAISSYILVIIFSYLLCYAIISYNLLFEYFLTLFVIGSLVRYLTREPWVDVSSIRVIANTAIPVIKLRTHALPAASVASASAGSAATAGVASGVGGSVAAPQYSGVISLDISFEGLSHKGALC